MSGQLFYEIPVGLFDPSELVEQKKAAVRQGLGGLIVAHIQDHGLRGKVTISESFKEGERGWQMIFRMEAEIDTDPDNL